MTEQFDFLKSEFEAERGMIRALNHSRDWGGKADDWLFEKKQGDEITADDAIYDCGLPDGTRNIVGAWFNGKAKQRLIRFSGKFCKSRRITRHTGLQRIWIVQ